MPVAGFMDEFLMWSTPKDRAHLHLQECINPAYTCVRGCPCACLLYLSHVTRLRVCAEGSWHHTPPWSEADGVLLFRRSRVVSRRSWAVCILLSIRVFMWRHIWSVTMETKHCCFILMSLSLLPRLLSHFLPDFKRFFYEQFPSAPLSLSGSSARFLFINITDWGLFHHSPAFLLF